MITGDESRSDKFRKTTQSEVRTEEALSDMTDFQKLGEYLNFLVVVLERGKRNYVNQNMIGAIRKVNALHKHK